MAKFTFGKLSLFKDKRIWVAYHLIFAFAMWFFMKCSALRVWEGAEDGPDGVVRPPTLRRPPKSQDPKGIFLRKPKKE
jgi:hypothetical protein